MILHVRSSLCHGERDATENSSRTNFDGTENASRTHFSAHVLHQLQCQEMDWCPVLLVAATVCDDVDTLERESLGGVYGQTQDRHSLSGAFSVL